MTDQERHMQQLREAEDMARAVATAERLVAMHMADGQYQAYQQKLNHRHERTD